MVGAASNTERGRFRSGLRDSPAKTLALSNPAKAPIDIFVNTFKVAIDQVGTTNEKGVLAMGSPLVHRRANRYTRNSARTRVRIDPAPVIHLPKCSPRTLTAKIASRQMIPTAIPSQELLNIHAPFGPAT